MDRLTEQRVKAFGKKTGYTDELPGLFEKYVAFNYLKKYIRNDMTLIDQVQIGGKKNDGGVDAAAIIVNGDIMTDPDDVESAIADRTENTVRVIFIQAKTSEKHDAKLLAKFLHGVRMVSEMAGSISEFQENPEIRKKIDEGLRPVALILNAVVNNIEHFISLDIPIELYYVTTSTHGRQDVLSDSQVQKATQDIITTGLYGSDVQCRIQGREDLFAKVNEHRGPQDVKFKFPKRVSIPPAEKVEQAYIGLVSVDELVKILTEDGRQLRAGIFEDNVRLYLGDENDVNEKIYSTLDSKARLMFPFLNNGITLTVKKLNVIADEFIISGYQIVNGCQTSNQIVRFINSIQDDSTRESLVNIFVPIKVISSAHSDIVEQVTVATNSQTPIKEESIQGSSQQAKLVEEYFSQTGQDGLRYERQISAEKNKFTSLRVVNTDQINRAFSSCVFGESAVAIESPKKLRSEGSKIWDDYDVSIYFFACWIQYRVESYFRRVQDGKQIQVAKYHIAMLAAAQIFPQLCEIYRGNKNPKAYKNLVKHLGCSEWKAEVDGAINVAVNIVKDYFHEKLENDVLIKNDVRYQHVQKGLLEKLRSS